MEPEVLHRSDVSQNDHKSKGYLPVKNDLKRLEYPTFIRLFEIRLNNPSHDPVVRIAFYTVCKLPLTPRSLVLHNRVDEFCDKWLTD